MHRVKSETFNKVRIPFFYFFNYIFRGIKTMAKKKTTQKESTPIGDVGGKANEKKSFRLLKNPEQTAGKQIYYNQNNEAIVVSKEGYYFSKDKEMDETIKYLKDEYGFIEVK